MLTSMLAYALTLAISTWNPMKICMLLMLYSMTTMAMLYKNMGKSWMPMSIYLLFMGGILLMFMILSSILPNEKSKKVENKYKMKTIMMVLGTIISPFMFNLSTLEQLQQIKSFIVSSMNMPLILSIMIMYFSLFVLLTNDNKNSMRKV